jgi:hypothetical protein
MEARKEQKNARRMVWFGIFFLIIVAIAFAIILNGNGNTGDKTASPQSSVETLCKSYLSLDIMCTQGFYDGSGVARKLAEGVQQECTKLPAFKASCASPSFACVKACCQQYGC